LLAREIGGSPQGDVGRANAKPGTLNYRGNSMRNLSLLGVVLVVLGAGALLLGHFSYFETKPVLDAGPLHVTAQEEHHVSIPLIAGIVVVIAGVGLIVAGHRTT